MPVLDSAAPWVPEENDPTIVRNAALACRGCPLWRDATQTVFGEGPVTARWMLVGEAPGDREDREGRPFVGPAGRLLDECLEEVGLDRREAWVTNAVKHFRFKVSGKRRLHERPRTTEIVACRPWITKELEMVRPSVLVCLGATAAQALLGRTFRVTVDRGRPVASALAPHVFATVHPSSLLRNRRDPGWPAERARFVADLRQIVDLLER
jgi:uracil-DNA glycosylase